MLEPPRAGVFLYTSSTVPLRDLDQRDRVHVHGPGLYDLGEAVNFDNAVTYLLQNEKGYVNKENDLGGRTNFGITQKFLTAIKTDEKTAPIYASFPDDVVNLTQENAITIYHNEFWLKFRYDEIHNLAIATCLLDVSVNTGPHQAGTCAQLACGYVVTDGVIGTKTIATLNDIEDIDKWLHDFLDHLTDYYFGIVSQNSTQFGNLRGWIKRALRMILLLEPV